MLASSSVATIHGEHSVWLQRLVMKRALALGTYSGALAAAIIAAATLDSRLAVGLLLSGIVFARRRTGVLRRYLWARQGAAGERATAHQLALLPASFVVLHDLEFPGFNVDHVVVGPTGVWAIETKSHTGHVEERADNVWRDGRPMYRDPRRQARAGAATIAELLARATATRYWVEALVCLPHATVTASGPLAAARVIGRQQLLMRLRLGPVVLDREARDRIVRVLRAAKQRPRNGVVGTLERRPMLGPVLTRRAGATRVESCWPAPTDSRSRTEGGRSRRPPGRD